MEPRVRADAATNNTTTGSPPTDHESTRRRRLAIARQTALQRLPEWKVARTESLLFVSDLPDNRFRRYRESVLAEFYLDFRRFIGEPTPTVCTIALAATASSFESAGRELVGTNRFASRFGYFDSHLKIAVVCASSDGERRLRHELTHVHMHGWRAPTWLSEGLATLMESPLRSSSRPQERDLWRNRLRSVLEARHTNQAVALNRLVQTRDFAGSEQPLRYATSAALCQFLIEKKALKPIIDRLRKGEFSSSELPRLLDTKWETLDASFGHWLTTRMEESR